MKYSYLDTLIGRILIAGDDDAICAIRFERDNEPDAGWIAGMNKPIREASRQLQLYFAGKLHDFALPLRPEGTTFQRTVWRALQDIPYGETISYGELARRVGNPSASRAVGAANGANPIPIVIPCHRVIGANGKLTGFGGGLPIKQRLLGLEAAQMALV
jgi:methylated-DNA-[protein]-cysteine S-methyltransferase